VLAPLSYIVCYYYKNEVCGRMTAMSHANCNFKTMAVAVQCSGVQRRLSRGNTHRQSNTTWPNSVRAVFIFKAINISKLVIV
jgi:hypothetical protein